MEVLTQVPECMVYDNKTCSDKTTRACIRIGVVLTAPQSPAKREIVKHMMETIKQFSDFAEVKINPFAFENAISLPKSKVDCFDSNKLIGEYVVTKAVWGGGGTGHGPHDRYPSAWEVTARKLNKRGEFNPKGTMIFFHQETNCYIATNENIPVIRKMKESFA
jgi:hypothetical protein